MRLLPWRRRDRRIPIDLGPTRAEEARRESERMLRDAEEFTAQLERHARRQERLRRENHFSQRVRAEWGRRA